MGDDYYLVAEEAHLSHLAVLVNNMMRAGEGWMPAGGVFMHPHHGTFCQAVYRDRSHINIECFHCPDDGFVRMELNEHKP